MPLLGSFNLTVQYMSGRSITLSVEKLHYMMWVIEQVDRELDLRSSKYFLSTMTGICSFTMRPNCKTLALMVQPPCI